MTLNEYIKLNYDGSPTWFVDEVQRPYHRDRVMNMIDIKEYLNGKHAIKTRPDEVYNGRTFKTTKICLQYVKPILAFETSFLLKKPVTLVASDKKTLQAFKDVYAKGRYNSLDFKLLDKIVKYGLVFEYLYLDDNREIKSKLILPEDSYPVYDDNNNYIAFIEHYTVASSGVSYYNVYTDDLVITYDNRGGDLRKTGEYINLSGLPVPYRTMNEEDELQGRSDLEDYIDIIDSMEELLSKYHDAFFKFLNPIPVVTGTKLNIGENGEGAIDPNTVGYALQLDDGSKFDLVTNRMDYQSLKELFNTLKQCLLDISMTPAVSLNSQEISNLSEVSIKLLFSLAEIKGSLNATYLKDGFIQRWEKIRKLLQYKGIKVNGDVDCKFEMSIPQNEKEIIENLQMLKDMGAISLDTLLANSPYIYDVEGEKIKLSNGYRDNMQ